MRAPDSQNYQSRKKGSKSSRPAVEQPPAVALSGESGTDNFDTMSNSSILVAGAGAIGSILGGMLHDAGHDVTLLGRRAHLEAIARRGLKISGLLGDRTVAGMTLADDAARLGRRFGLILCAVKSYDTESMAAGLADHLSDDGAVVSMQNGLGNIELLIESFGPRRVLGARVIGPAPAIHREDSAALATRARAIAAMIDAAAVPAVGVDDIMPVLWTKVLYNVALNPLGAILQQHYGALAEDPDVKPIMDRAIEEAFAVARALGIALPFSSAAEYRKVFYEQMIPPTSSHRPTMLHDLHVRGRTEIGALNGKIVELADRLGLNAETNRILTRLIRAAERVTQKKKQR
jgi:2-dehydropantoate 2-reductase